ncbi:MAG: PilZ domain-containing protein [Candidatus Binatia bacterium]
MTPLRLVRTTLSHSERHTRHDARCSVILPLRLTTGSGEMIPAVVLNVSSSGLLAVVDERASLILPLPRGSHVDGEFFFDDLAVPQLTLEIVRSERRSNNQFALGCKFVNLSPQVAADIRVKISARLRKGDLHKSQ